MEALKLDIEPVRIAAINADHLDLLIDDVVPLIDKALVHACGELDRDIILQEVRDGNWLLLSAVLDGDILGICAGYIQTFQTGKRVLSVPVTSGGKIELWLEPMLEAWRNLAPYYGCCEVYGGGRKGWGKLLENHGIETIHTTYRMVI